MALSTLLMNLGLDPQSGAPAPSTVRGAAIDLGRGIGDGMVPDGINLGEGLARAASSIGPMLPANLASPASPASPEVPFSPIMRRDTSGYAADQTNLKEALGQPLAEDDPVALMHKRMLAGESKMDDAVKALQELYGQHPDLKEMQFGKNDLLKLAPLVVALFMGKNGQQFAGGYGMGLLKGKQREADLANQNAALDFESKIKSAEAGVKAAGDQMSILQKEQDAMNDQKKAEAMYGLGNPKMLAGQVKSWEDQIKSNKGNTAPALVALDRMFTTTQGKLGRPLDPSEYQRALDNDKSYQNTVSATGDLKNAQKDQITEYTRGSKIKNDFFLQTEPIQVNNLHLKNTKILADIDAENKRALAALKNADSNAKRAESVLGMNEAHANLYGALAASVQPKTQAYVDEAYQRVASMRNRDIEMVGKEERKAINTSLNRGISAITSEINQKERGLQSARKELSDPVLQANLASEKDENGPFHAQAAKLQQYIDQSTTRLSTVLYPSQQQLMDQAKGARASMGLGPDGSIVKSKAPATGTQLRPTPEPGRTRPKYTQDQISAGREAIRKHFNGNVPADVKSKFKAETGVDF